MNITAWSCAAILGVACLLSSRSVADLPEQTQVVKEAVRRDAHGDPLPPGALARLGTIRFRAEGYVSSIAFSPDGKTVVAGDSAGLVYLWDAATGNPLRRLDAGGANPKVSFSPDGRQLIARTSMGEIRLWQAATGELLASFARRQSDWQKAETFLFSPCGRQLIVIPEFNALIAVRNGKHEDAYVIGKDLPDQAVEVLDPATGRAVRRLCTNDPHTVFADAALAPDGALLAVSLRAFRSPRKHVRLIETATGAVMREIRAEGAGWFLSVAFTPDGKSLALGGKDEIVLADVSTGRQTDRLTAPMGTVAFLAFTSDAQTLVAHGHDNQVRLWDLASRKQRLVWEAEADGHLVLPLPTGGFRPAQTDELYWKARRTALSPDGKSVAVATGSTLHFWDLGSGEKRFPQFAQAEGWARTLAFSPDGRLVLVSGSEQTRLWDHGRSEVVHAPPLGAGLAAFAPDGRRFAFAPTENAGAGDAQAVVVWDVAAAKESCRLGPEPGERRTFTALAFTADGRALLTCDAPQADPGHHDGTVLQRWDLDTGKALGNIRRGDAYPWGTAAAPDARTAVIERAPELVVIDTETGEELFALAGAMPEGWKGTPVFSPDGHLLLVWNPGGCVSVWEAATGSLVARYCLLPRGNLSLKEWPTRSGKKEDLFDQGQSGIEAVVVSPDGRYAASSERPDYGRERTRPQATGALPAIRIWEISTGAEVQRLEGFRARSTALAFSPGGNRLASWLDNGTILVWDTSFAARQAARTGRRLTAEEWGPLWADLAGADAARALRAITALEKSPAETVEHLGRHLRPVPAQELDGVRTLVASLDDANFAKRKAATQELEGLVERYADVLRQALKEKPTLEMHTRLTALLAAGPRQLSPETRRVLRSIQTLERIGTAEASQLLAALAGGAAGARETSAAQEAHRRLSARLRARY